MEKRIDAFFENWQQGLCAGGQVLVIHKGKTIYEKNFGYANLETQTPMASESVFHVASVTKQFTAMAILILQERGLLNVDEDVHKYLPDLIHFEEPVTLRQMLNMVSGIRGYYELMELQGRHHEDHYAQREIRRIIGRQTKLNFKPGEKFVYTNANYMLLATIVERLSGQSFNEFAIENIFKPLGMDHSFVRDDPHVLIPNKVNSYHDDGYNFTNAILTFGIYGGTSLHTTARDLAKFLHQYIEPTLISRETMEAVSFTFPMIGEKRSHYSAGLMTEMIENYRVYHHGGVNAGFRTIGMVVPEEELIVVIFANNYNVPVIPRAKDIIRVVLGLPERKINYLEDYARDTVSLEGVGGMYYNHKKGVHWKVDVKDGKVYLDGDYMAPAGGNRFKHGRRSVWLAIMEDGKVVAKHGPTIDEVEKLTDYPDAEYLERCVGQYYCDDMEGKYNMVHQDGKLWIEHLRFGLRELYWVGNDTFFYDKFKVRFTFDATGKCTGYLVNSPHLTNVEFVKIK